MEREVKKIVFLCSGNGGNLIFIHKAIQLSWLEAEIISVITDRLCLANEFASNMNIDNKVIDFRENGQIQLYAILNKYDPDVIVTTVHKIISTKIIGKYGEKLINLHYSLLPSFGALIGELPVKKALSYGVKIAGVTTHYISEHVDMGRPITQIAIPLKSDEPDFTLLMSIFFKCGCVALLGAIFRVLNVSRPYEQVAILNIKNYTCLSNGTKKPEIYLNDDVWSYIKNQISFLKSNSHKFDK